MDHRLPPRVIKKISPEPNSGCWLWTGTITRGGYGQLHDRGVTEYAHRYVYEKMKGRIPLGRQMDHLCRLRCCVNPDHMEPVSQRENLIRGEGFAGKNHRKTTCKNGHSLEDAYQVKKGGRKCRACSLEESRRAYKKRKSS